MSDSPTSPHFSGESGLGQRETPQSHGRHSEVGLLDERYGRRRPEERFKVGGEALLGLRVEAEIGGSSALHSEDRPNRQLESPFVGHFDDSSKEVGLS